MIGVGSNAFNQPHESGIASAQVPTTQCASLLRLTLRRPPTEIEGLSQNWMSHHQIPRLDGDQAERCDGNLPSASRLMAPLSMTGHWAGQAFVEGEIPFSGGLNRWVLAKEGRKCFIFQWELTDLSPPRRSSPLYPIVRIDRKTNEQRDKRCCREFHGVTRSHRANCSF
jgi:hypothetical protein